MDTPYNYDDPYFFFKMMARRNNNAVHQQTCPVCGRTLVNLYRMHGVWKCRRCHEKEE